MPQSGERTRDQVLYQLKTKGPQPTSLLAERLEMTPMGMRQHLALLEEEGLVESLVEKGGVGRPAKVWRLTSLANARFPEGYAELAVDLLESVRESLGPEALETFVRHREARTLAHYRSSLPPRSAPLWKRVASLARLRSQEGYMAESRKQRDGSVLLIENHCPICAAAEVCQGLCRSELDLFRSALGPGLSIEREEHLLEGDRRCIYRVSPT